MTELYSSRDAQLHTILERDKQRWCQELVELLSIPSISADPSYRWAMEKSCSWLTSYLTSIGLSVEIIPTSRYPLVLASWLAADPEAPHIVIYNHYDVQPAEPLDLWQHPPFDPYIDQQGRIFARGAQDNKGQLFATLQAIRGCLQLGPLPCSVTLCIEGEEESGSVGFKDVLPTLKDRLRADAMLVIDVDVPSLQRPAITMGIRGNLSMTLTLTGSRQDLHSGLHGGIAYNANHALIELLASLRDPLSGRVMVAGFYDSVVEPAESDKGLLDLHFDGEEYFEETGALPIGGERVFEPLERNWLRPTLEINGLQGGYTGEGFKTVIPAQAMAKLSCRTVPDQDPEEIFDKVRAHLYKHLQPGMHMHLARHGSGRWVRTDPDSLVGRCAEKAVAEIMGAPCKRVMSGGSVPIIASLVELTGNATLFLGLGLSSDAIHAPNEHYSIDRVMALTRILGRFFDIYAQNYRK